MKHPTLITISCSHFRASTRPPCLPGTSTTTTTRWRPTLWTRRLGRRPRTSSTRWCWSSSPWRSWSASWRSSLFSVSPSVSKKDNINKLCSFADVSFNRSARSFDTSSSWRQNEVFGSWDQLQVTEEEDRILITSWLRVWLLLESSIY